MSRDKRIKILFYIAVALLGREDLFTALLRWWLVGAMFETTKEAGCNVVNIRVTI